MTDATTASTTATDGTATATAGGADAKGAAATQTTTATLLTGAAATGGETAMGDDAAAKAAAEAKAKADAAATGAPEKYEPFSLPEGFSATDEQMTEFGTLARELNLPQAAAQKVVDAHVKSMQSLRESMENANVAQEAAWRKAAEADKEFGGAELKSNMALASRALQQFGTPELTKFFTETTRLGDHPEVLRFFVRVGKALGEDQHFQGNVSGKTDRSMAERWYGDTMPKSQS